MLSKACLIGPYQKKLEEIARFSDVEMLVLVPESWKTDGREQKLERQHTNGYELNTSRIIMNGHFHLHFYPWLGQVIRRFRPDIFHIDEEPYNIAAGQAVALAKRHNVRPVFFTWQNLNQRYPPPFSWIERYCLKHSHAIAGSDAAGQVLQSHGFKNTLGIIPQFGVDPEIFCPIDVKSKSEDFVVGFAGRVTRQKGIRVLIEALKICGPGFTVRIAGDGPLISEFTKNGLQPELLGHITADKMPEYLRTLDALVLPSIPSPRWREQFGRVLVEAMSCGIPVIGSNSGEIPNVVGDAGLITQAGDYKQLATALKSLKNDEKLVNAFAEAGRNRVADKFSHRSIALQTVRFYRRLMLQNR
tara:strand:- start:3376 stop:4452 length:1077 start_codon:yes stop_codon:yes gene_type:complete